MKNPKNQKKIAEEAEEARKLGLDYGTYKGYQATGYLDTYKRIKFHEEVHNYNEPRIIEPSRITRGTHGPKID